MTGGTAGIGYGITAHLLQHNPEKIILVSHNEEHAAEAQEALEKYGDIDKLEWIQCDLKDLKRTVQVVERLKKESRIDAVGWVWNCKLVRMLMIFFIKLVCNAGEGVGKYNETVDGLGESQDVCPAALGQS